MINTNINYITKKQQQTTGLIQRLSNYIQLLSIGVIVSEKFCFSKRHFQFSQGVPVWRMCKTRLSIVKEFMTSEGQQSIIGMVTS